MSRRVWLVILVAWLGWVFDIMDTALFTFAKIPMLTEFLGGEAAYQAHGPLIEGQIQAFFLVGWSLGGLLFGILADRLGRARVLIYTILIYSLFTGLTALARSVPEVMGLRFLTGLGIGGEWAAGAALVAEVVKDAKRGWAAAILQSAAAFGPWLAALANMTVRPGDWRTLFLIGVVPALVCVLVRIAIQDSEPPADSAPRSNAREVRGNLSELFRSPALLGNTLVAMALGIVGVTGAGILPFWLPNLVKQAALGDNPTLVRDFTSLNTFTVHIGTLIGVFLFPILADRWGRRPTFALYLVMAPVSTAIALLGPPDLNRLLYLLPLASLFGIGLSAGFVLYFPELFPSRVRATGSGLAYNVGRIFSFPMPLIIGAIISGGGSAMAGVMVASGIYLFGLIALIFAPETRGKPLPT